MTTTPPFGNPYGPVSGGPPNPFSAQEGMPAATTGTPLFPEPAAAAPSAMRRLGAHRNHLTFFVVEIYPRKNPDRYTENDYVAGSASSRIRQVAPATASVCVLVT